MESEPVSGAKRDLLRLEWTEADLRLHPTGEWTAERAESLHEATSILLDREAEEEAEGAGEAGEVRIELDEIAVFDVTGAWLLRRLAARLVADRGSIQFVGATEAQRRILELIDRDSREERALDPIPEPPVALRALDALGERVIFSYRDARQMLGFLGMLMTSMLNMFLDPRIFPWRSLGHHMFHSGVRAFPIVSLIGFLIGTVLAYQGMIQLSRFGADLFVVDLIAISSFREVGILLTAVVVAGRSGSAFASEIGSMRLSDEVDAMRTMGLDPFCRLVAPRALALILMLPLLALAANLASLLGGALGSWTLADIRPGLFLNRLQDAVSPTTLAIGLVKAPVFAILIALAGCYQGLSVSQGAAELGLRTTRSVVHGIFLVIVTDALFSVFFAEIGI